MIVQTGRFLQVTANSLGSGAGAGAGPISDAAPRRRRPSRRRHLEERVNTDVNEITGVVLAGGRGRRMGSIDKGLIELGAAAMVVHVVTRLRPQVREVLVNANRNAARYAELTGCRVVADATGDYAGPLAGMASAMAVADTPLLLTAPCDSPLLAADLAARLHAALRAAHAEISVAHDGERLQPVFALLHTSLAASLALLPSPKNR